VTPDKWAAFRLLAIEVSDSIASTCPDTPVNSQLVDVCLEIICAAEARLLGAGYPFDRDGR
jgi:hypothetical protein